jgi:hypothetical protein
MTRLPIDDTDTTPSSPSARRAADLQAKVDKLQRRNRCLEIKGAILTVVVFVLIAGLVGALNRPAAGTGAEADAGDWGNFLGGLAIGLIATSAGFVSLIVGITAWRHVTPMHPFATAGCFGVALILALPILDSALVRLLAEPGDAVSGGALFGWMDPGVRTSAMVAAIVLVAIGVCNRFIAAANRRRLEAEE